MSRCFPYPPPGYVAKGERDEALIESSIKLQREREKAKAERRKERKREKNEKKEKKRQSIVAKRDARESKVNEKQNASEFGRGKKRKLTDEEHKWEKDGVDLEGRYTEKRGEDEAEQLERSNLTEEHEEPVNCPQNPCNSSDSSEDSNKRRRQASPVNGIRRTHGNILRIRISSQNPKEPDVASREEKLCSTDKTVQEEFFPTRTDDVCVRGLTPRLEKEQACSTSGDTDTVAQDNFLAARGSTSSGSGIQTVESLFKDLIENWVSPPLQSERTDLDEQDWLFPRKHPDRERANASNNDVSFTGSTISWPCAQYLPEADIFALPFAVPF